ncbi:MAG: UvrD-helicase domain-containing protein [Caldilineaceae bacterium]|nr:UvrD-helicase domain-containing protein [Caldilineaceae bacterium]
MPVYEIAFKKAFTLDGKSYPRNLRDRVLAAIDELRTQAESPRGDTIKPLGGFKSLWRYRIDDYRLVYGVKGFLVTLLNLAHRSEVYERYHYSDADAFDSDSARPTDSMYTKLIDTLLESNEKGMPEWAEREQERLRLIRKKQQEKFVNLPRHITRLDLESWKIPPSYHQLFLDCRTGDDLLKCAAPSDLVEQVMDYLYPRPADQVVQQPTYILPKTQDLFRYVDGDLIGFLLKLDDEQSRYITWGLDGPTLLKGGPGSGKSTVALYRSKELVQRRAGRVLFVTFTNMLVGYSEQLLKTLLNIDMLPEQQICIATLDSIANKIVNHCRSKQGLKRLTVNGSGAIKAGINRQKEALKIGNHADATVARLLQEQATGIDLDYLVDEIEWVIEGQNVQSMNEYLTNVDRAGRGIGLNDNYRRAIWQIYSEVRAFCREYNMSTYGQIRQEALYYVQTGQWSDRWDFVILDEAQDLTPTAIALAVSLCRTSQGIFLTADASQSIYNRGFIWQKVHDNLKVVGRTRLLKRNYRSTKQIALAAASILHGTDSGDEESISQTHVYSGPRPEVLSCQDSEELYVLMVEAIQSATVELRSPIGGAAVLVPTNKLAEQVADALSSFGLPATQVDKRNVDLKTPYVKVMTLHSAKGLEFPVIILPFVEDGILPPLQTQRPISDEHILAAARRLFYVGSSRAMQRLFVLHREGYASPLLKSLSQEHWQI